jgi:hypothetical protein
VQWRLQPGKVVPEGPISGCLKGLDPGVLIDALAYGRATPTAAEQATRDFSRQGTFLGHVIADRKRPHAVGVLEGPSERV